ncbi:hypothetical protein BC828DRAFT_409575 [Blastocladiella britannica]|nr:hypothetical protein BC828DRAFT_409575 [Blastocladiella britannica]
MHLVCPAAAEQSHGRDSQSMSNLTKPTPTTPSLLTHDEIVTMFHAFGHIVHSTKYARFSGVSGVSLSRDLVEALAQLYENWVWEPAVLKALSSHYQTGAKIPDTPVDNLCRSKTVGNGAAFRWGNDAGVPDAAELYARLSRELALAEAQTGTHPLTTFEHIMSSDDAGYHGGYLFSEVFAQDMYAQFKAAPDGIINKAVGAKYRAKVIGRGGHATSSACCVRSWAASPTRMPSSRPSFRLA